MKPSIVLFVLAAGMTAQVVVPPPQTVPGRFQANFDDLKNALGLTDQQVAELQKIQQEKTAATSAYFVKLQEKRKELSQTLESGSPDPTKVGQSLIEIQQMQKQGQPQALDVHDKAVAVLNADQKLKLAKLEEALKARPAVDEAIQVFLLNPPPPASRPVPGGAGAMPRVPVVAAPTPQATPKP